MAPEVRDGLCAGVALLLTRDPGTGVGTSLASLLDEETPVCGRVILSPQLMLDQPQISSETILDHPAQTRRVFDHRNMGNNTCLLLETTEVQERFFGQTSW